MDKSSRQQEHIFLDSQGHRVSTSPPRPPRPTFLGALRLWSYTWLAPCLWLIAALAVLGHGRWVPLVVSLWAVGQRVLAWLTLKDPLWDERAISRLLGKPYPPTKGGQA